MELSSYAELFDALKDCQNCEISENEYLDKHSTFRIGGPADVFLCPAGIADFLQILQAVLSLNIHYKIIGNASNILFSDLVFRGVMIKTTAFTRVSVSGTIVQAECGATLAKCARYAHEMSLSGFEKLGGIPGTVGGALAMNAGAFGTEISDILLSATVFDIKRREIKKLPKEELAFGYRTSAISDRDLILLCAEFALTPGNSENILDEMLICIEKRQKTQPLNLPSAGSIFKRPPNDYAGRLIEAAGLKGVRIGDAEVSEKHAGFIVNRGCATAKDVCELISLVQKQVRETSDVLLACEIEILSER